MDCIAWNCQEKESLEAHFVANDVWDHIIIPLRNNNNVDKRFSPFCKECVKINVGTGPPGIGAAPFLSS